MKNLGLLTVHNQDTLVDGRRKVYDISKELSFNESNSIRLSTIFSELVRVGYHDATGVKVSISIREHKGCHGLNFEFVYSAKSKTLPPANSFFDIFEKHSKEDNTIGVKAFKYFSTANFYPDNATIIKVKHIIALPSKEAMFQEMRKLSSAVEQSPATVLITDVDGNIEYVNPQFCKLTGYKASEVIGQNPRILKSEGALPPEFYRNLWETITKGNIWYGDVCNKKKDGTVFWESASISPIRDANDKISHFVSIKVDITEKKRMMKEIETAKRMADEANKAKGEFLANMSHEIRTPMNAIIGMNHLLQKTKLNSKQKNFADKVDKAAHNLLGIINDILDFSKIEAGKLDVENIEFDLSDVFDHLSNVISIKAQEKDLELLFDVDSDVPHNLIGDPLRLGQVLLNLSSNAIKFTEQGEVAILVKLNKKTKTSADIQFSVKDSGIGLTPEQQSKLFHSFSQADSSTTRKFGGTGLGLTIAKKLVKMMGGDISLKSEFGVGSEFSFNIVAGRHHNDKEKLHIQANDLVGIRVLVVDDCESTRQVLQNYVEGFDFYVTTAKSGEEAIMEINKSIETGEKRYDLILMDWKMPGMTGIEASRIIKNNCHGTETPHIIILSNYSREDIMTQAEGITIDSFMTKPISQSQLFDAILNVFGKNIQTKASADSPGLQEEEQLKNMEEKHILLVEDNEINQEVAVGLLEEAVKKVDVANNGREAVDIINEKGEDYYDVVLMDLQMPEMDGYEATEYIRKKLKFTELPVIAMSADAMVGVKEKCLEIGMSDYLSKPINPGELFSTLKTWLKVDNIDIPETPVEEKSSESLVNIEGLDASAGLARVGGKLKTYKGILKMFCTNNENVVEQLKEAISSEDKELSVRIAHTVKGVAGNIGAVELAKNAAAIEKYLKDDKPDKASKMLDDFNKDLTEMIVSIKNSELMKGEQNAASGGFDPVKSGALITKLSELLEENDSDAQECVEELLEMGGDSDLEKIAELINNFEFDDALDLLGEFIKKHDIG